MAVSTVQKDRGAYLEIECGTAEEFVSQIASAEQIPPGAHLFRGQTYGDAPMVPTFLRNDRWEGFEAKSSKADRRLRLCLAEYQVYRRFSARVQGEGLPYPWEGRTHTLGEGYREQLEQARTINDAAALVAMLLRLPPKEVHGLFALAQHHGVPTRFLDWSESPHVAMYFAASGAARNYKSQVEQKGRKRLPQYRLAVFVLNEDLLAMVQGRSTVNGSALNVVRVPRFLSPNLAAQRGVFTFDAGAFDPKDDLAKRISAEAKGSPAESLPIVTKVSLPWREAPKVLQTLAGFGVSAASIFPGYDGIASALVEERYWANKSEFGPWDAKNPALPWRFDDDRTRQDHVLAWANARNKAAD